VGHQAKRDRQCQPTNSEDLIQILFRKRKKKNKESTLRREKKKVKTIGYFSVPLSYDLILKKKKKMRRRRRIAQSQKKKVKSNLSSIDEKEDAKDDPPLCRAPQGARHLGNKK